MLEVESVRVDGKQGTTKYKFAGYKWTVAVTHYPIFDVNYVSFKFSI